MAMLDTLDTPSRSETLAPVQGVGHLEGWLDDGAASVRGEDGVLRYCRRAASCLVAPQAGDLVLFGGPDRYRCYVLAVLELAGDGPCVVSPTQPLVLRSDSGQVRLEADTLGVKAAIGDMQIDNLGFTGRTLRATVGTLRLIGRQLDLILQHCRLNTRQSTRLVEDTEQVRVGRLDVQAAHELRLHASHTLLTARDLVKVDAEQIHMG